MVFATWPELMEVVDGPLITNVLKSSLIWQMLVLHLQMLTRHSPLSLPWDSMYVQFSEEVKPQLAET